MGKRNQLVGTRWPCIYQRLTFCMQLAVWGQERLCRAVHGDGERVIPAVKPAHLPRASSCEGAVIRPPEICQITPHSLQGKDKSGNAHKDNSNLIHQYKSARAFVPKESYPDIQACSDHSTAPTTYCAARDCLLPLSVSHRLHRLTLLASSLPSLSCSTSVNWPGRTMICERAPN